jgi:hypothetical protein
MSIFDSPSVTFHVDDDLEYVYVPAALALFEHVIAGLKAVQSKIHNATTELTAGATTPPVLCAGWRWTASLRCPGDQ